MPNRILLTAPASGGGKTLITCGILRALQKMGKKPVSFKCGPDYIDPMFHSRVLGTKSRNLDTFFTSDETVRRLLAENSADCDIAVLEGVMGYYDGIAGTAIKASAYDVARATGTPAILIVNSRGASTSLIPLIRGFLQYQNGDKYEISFDQRQDFHDKSKKSLSEEFPGLSNSRKTSGICGIIFNRMSPMLYPRMKELTEKELPIPVVGFLPELSDCAIESRHLGLVMPDEIAGLQEKIDRLADRLLETLEWDVLLSIAAGAEEISAGSSGKHCETGKKKTPVRVAVASDEAFCFFYEDNFRLLKDLGAKLVFFSPLHDAALPEHISGLLLFGGYPELHAEKLSENVSMRTSIRTSLAAGLPCMAECGGFLYLHEQMDSAAGTPYPMAGVIPGHARKTEKLNRFGYITLSGGTVFGKEVGAIPSHEFHYYDSDCCGDAFLAKKPESRRSWRCIHSTGSLFAGFPHMYYEANPAVAEAFLDACRNYSG